MARKRYTIGEKLAVLQDLTNRQAAGESLKSVACLHGVTPPQIRKWRANRDEMMRQKRDKKAIFSGRRSGIEHLEEEIFSWAMRQRAANIPLSYRHLQARACRLDEDFRNLTNTQQYTKIRRLCIKNCFVLRRKTTKSNAHPQETIDKSLAFLQIVRPIISAPDSEKKFIINMDQTPIWFSMPPQSTLELQGSTTIGIRSTSNSTERATCCLAVSAAGDKLKPMIIFKGVSNGRIATREFSTYQNYQNVALACQPHA